MVPEEEQEKQDEEHDNDDESEAFSEITNEEEDYIFGGMRMFFQRVENEEVEEEEEEEEEAEEEDMEEPEEIPPFELFVRKLQGQGVTYEEFVKYALLEHDEFSFDREYEAIGDNIFATIRIAISNFNNQPQPRTQFDARFQNIFTTAFMPDFESMFTSRELKVICREYGIRYGNSRQIPSLLSNLWNRHHQNI
jgi:hypothetical protein